MGIDLTKLNKAIDTFGSLQKANAQLETERLALEKKNAQLKQANQKMAATRDKLSGQAENLRATVKNYEGQIQSLYNRIKAHGPQYDLFSGFMAMVVGSPSVTDSLTTLLGIFQKLNGSGWYVNKNADDMRSLFVRTVMGDYLKCFRCDTCGARFITNKEPKHKYFGNGYYCPACHNSYAVKEDDSFLKALVSEKQLDDTQRLETVMEELKVLLPFEAFLDVPCEICHELVKEWDDYNIELAIQGIGYGHTHCWRSELGQLREFRKAIEIFKKETK
ncbi:cell division protein ZapB [Chloroflexota bacterium]